LERIPFKTQVLLLAKLWIPSKLELGTNLSSGFGKNLSFVVGEALDSSKIQILLVAKFQIPSKLEFTTAEV